MPPSPEAAGAGRTPADASRSPQRWDAARNVPRRLRDCPVGAARRYFPFPPFRRVTRCRERDELLAARDLQVDGADRLALDLVLVLEPDGGRRLENVVGRAP